MSLIINADDFGKSKEVNRAISECFNKGYINRTTIMVNMPDAVEALNIAQKNGFADRVGLHINLTEGMPLTDGIKKNPYFCNNEGEYNQVFCHSTRLRLHMDDKSIYDIEKEIEAQLKMYAELGFTLNHLDSHHHVHNDVPVYKAIKNISGVYDFSSIRILRNLYRGGNALKKLYKAVYNKKIKRLCHSTTEYFGSFTDAVDYFPAGAGFSEFKDKHNVEIMVHPMYADDGTLVDTSVPFSLVHSFFSE